MVLENSGITCIMHGIMQVKANHLEHEKRVK